MSFFNDLSSLAKTVDKELNELNLNQCQPYNHRKSEEEQEEHSAKARLLISGISSEMKNLKGQMQVTFSELRGCGFVELVNAATALVNKEKEQLEEIENYLKQYGFEPLPSAEATDSEIAGETDDQKADKHNVPATVVEESSESVSTAHRGIKLSKGLAACNGDSDIDSPVVPILATPGIKQIRHMRMTCTVDNVESDASPAHPELLTPAVKHVLQLQARQPAVQTPQPLTDNLADLGDTPEMPELTYNFADLQLMRAKYAPTGNKSESNTPLDPCASKSGPAVLHSCTTESRELPPVPQLTYAMSSVLQEPNRGIARSVSPALPVLGYTLKRPSVEEEDADMSFPEMPQLTGTYNFNVPRIPAHVEHKVTETKSYGDKEDKENQAPSTGCSYLISKEEYEAQPDYIRAHVSLVSLNKRITDMQQIMTSKSERVMTEEEVSELLGPDTRFVLLSLLRLDKLVKTKHAHTSRPAYALQTNS